MTRPLCKVFIRLLFILSTLLIISVFAPAQLLHADSNWHQDLSDMKADSLLSGFDNSLAVSHCGGTDSPTVLKSFTQDGSVQSELSTASPTTYFCDNQKAIDKKGVIYGVRNVPNLNYANELVAYKDGTLIWSHLFTASQPNCTQAQLAVQHMAVGADGNIEVAINQSNPQCEEHSYIAVVRPDNGQELSMTRLDGNAISWMGTYNNGLAVIQYLSSTIHYFDLLGHPQASFSISIPQGDHAGIAQPTLDATGTIYFAVNQDFSSNDECRTNIVTDNALTYSPAGTRLGSYTIPPCSMVTSIASGPWGAAFLLHNYLSNQGTANKVVTLNQKGTLLASIDLPAITGSSTFYNDSPNIMSDINGNLILKRTYSTKNPDGNLAPPNTQISLLNPSKDTISTSFDTHAFDPTGKVGFHTTQIALAKGLLYLLGQACHDSTCVYDPPYQLYAVPLPGVGIDYPRGAIALPPSSSQSPTPNTVSAIGDSFISGEGIPPFGPNIQDTNCHRSLQAWPKLLDADKRLNLKLTSFAACSGATALDMRAGSNTHSMQVTSLKSTDNTVLISAGGNDIKFSQYAAICLLANCKDHQKGTVQLINKLDKNLDQLYTSVRVAAPNAKVYVMGYPALVPTRYCNIASGSQTAVVESMKLALLGNPSAIATMSALAKYAGLTPTNLFKSYIKYGLSLSDADAISANLVINKLNLKILDETQKYSNFFFVSSTYPQSPFTGHDVCAAKDKGSYFNGIVLPPNQTYSLHPNFLGAKAYEEVFYQYYSGTKPKA
jgi:hypothetical protein